jgi:hypothetical protein
MEGPFLSRLPKQADLLQSLTSEFSQRGVETGSFLVIGAVTSATIGFYNVFKREYEVKSFQGQYEIVNCTGNISLRDGKVFVHAHIVLADQDLKCFGGHLMEGTQIFAAELSAFPLSGDALTRVYDEPTGLFLWSMD